MQREMRAQFRRYAIPHLRVQPPSVQQHKMAISFTFGLPPNVVHQLLFPHPTFEVQYANSPQLLLAMPNAAGDFTLGRLLPLRANIIQHTTALPSVRASGGDRAPRMRALPA
jgi:hypothetical protein